MGRLYNGLHPNCQCAEESLLTVFECAPYQHVTESTHFRPGQSPSRLDSVFSNEEGMVGNLKYNLKY